MKHLRITWGILCHPVKHLFRRRDWSVLEIRANKRKHHKRLDREMYMASLCANK